MRLPPHRFLNIIYTWSISRIDPERREEWEAMLNDPLPGEEAKPSDTDLEMDGDSFMSAMTLMTGGDS